MTSVPNASLPQLLYLCEAARGPSLTAAAHRLGISQPALSQGLAELERRLGLQLFERRGRQRIPTAHAATVIASAQRVLAASHDLARSVDRLRTGEIGTVRVGLIDAAALYRLPDAIRSIRRERPDLDLRLVVASSNELLEALARGELDLAVTVVPHPLIDRQPDAFDVTVLGDEPLVVYGPDGERDRPPSAWGPWAMFPSTSRTRALVDEGLAQIGVAPEVLMESNNPEVLRQMVRLEVAWTVLPRPVAEAEPAPLRPVGRPVATRAIGAVRRSDAPPDVAVELLLRRAAPPRTRVARRSR